MRTSLAHPVLFCLNFASVLVIALLQVPTALGTTMVAFARAPVRALWGGSTWIAYVPLNLIGYWGARAVLPAVYLTDEPGCSTARGGPDADPQSMMQRVVRHASGRGLKAR